MVDFNKNWTDLDAQKADKKLIQKLERGESYAPQEVVDSLPSHFRRAAKHNFEKFTKVWRTLQQSRGFAWFRRGQIQLRPPAGGYTDESGRPIKCLSDWHDNHAVGSSCPECGELDPFIETSKGIKRRKQ